MMWNKIKLNNNSYFFVNSDNFVWEHSILKNFLF
jgi:hypothetical protein